MENKRRDNYSNFSLFYALATAATKKTTIGDRQCTYYLIVRAVTIADFTIDRPALLEINRKIATMGGGDYHLVEKRASLCSASVCFLESRGAPEKKTHKSGAPE